MLTPSSPLRSMRRRAASTTAARDMRLPPAGAPARRRADWRAACGGRGISPTVKAPDSPVATPRLEAIAFSLDADVYTVYLDHVHPRTKEPPMSSRQPVPTLLPAAGVLIAGARDARALTPGQSCEKNAAKSLSSCVRSVGKAEWKCYRDTGSGCAPGDANVLKALGKLGTKVGASCPDAATVVAAGYPPLLGPATLVARLQEACTTGVATLVARSFGGPHAAVRNAASDADQDCLDRAYTKGLSLVDYGYRQYSKCILKAHAGGVCDAASVSEKIAKREARTVTSIAAKCSALSDLVGVDPTMFSARGSAQSRCLVPTAHSQTTPFDLDCGPRGSVPVPARATPTQIVLDGAATGTRCGDGSPYAFWIRLAAEGGPLE